MEQIAGETPGSTAKAFARLQGLNFFNDLEGQVYAYDEIVGWLRKVGFASPRRIDLRRAPGFSVVMGRKAR